MATRNLRTSFGATRRYYAQALVGATWVTQGSAANDAQLSALIARVQARKPGAALVVVSFDRQGRRTERAVEQTAPLAA